MSVKLFINIPVNTSRPVLTDLTYIFYYVLARYIINMQLGLFQLSVDFGFILLHILYYFECLSAENSMNVHGVLYSSFIVIQHFWFLAFYYLGHFKMYVCMYVCMTCMCECMLQYSVNCFGFLNME